VDTVYNYYISTLGAHAYRLTKNFIRATEKTSMEKRSTRWWEVVRQVHGNMTRNMVGVQWSNPSAPWCSFHTVTRLSVNSRSVRCCQRIFGVCGQLRLSILRDFMAP